MLVDREELEDGPPEPFPGVNQPEVAGPLVKLAFRTRKQDIA